MTPLKKDWLKIYTPLVEHMKLQVRMNLRSKAVELRSCSETAEIGALQKGADFVRAYGLGFDLEVNLIFNDLGCHGIIKIR
jgi:RNA-binding protein PNO1